MLRFRTLRIFYDRAKKLNSLNSQFTGVAFDIIYNIHAVSCMLSIVQYTQLEVCFFPHQQKFSSSCIEHEKVDIMIKINKFLKGNEGYFFIGEGIIL